MTIARALLALLLPASAAAQARLAAPLARPPAAAPAALSARAPGLSSSGPSAAPLKAEPVLDAGAAARFAVQARTLHRRLLHRESLLELARRRARALRPDAAPTDGDMQGRMEDLPKTNPERERYMIELFRRGGAAPAEIRLQKVGEGQHNIFVLKKGATDRLIVVGGHHDQTHVGEGKIDNGTGATMVANLYQTFRDVATQASLLFIAFAREEEGLLGSRHFVRNLTPEQLRNVHAMINLDTLAVDGTFRWMPRSDDSLLDRAAEAAKAAGVRLLDSELRGGDSDSTPFRQRGIPAMTVLGASERAIWRVIHSPRDTMAAFSLQHYKDAYLLTAALLKSLDKTPLGHAFSPN